MNNPDYDRFIQECSDLPYLIDQQKDAVEDSISAFLSNPQNWPAIQKVMETEPNAQIKLITIESLNKIILTKGKAKVVHTIDSSSLRPLINAETPSIEEELSNYFTQLVKYLLSYLKQNHATNPKFIVNSIANAVATFLEVQAYNCLPLEGIGKLILDEFFGFNCGANEYYIGLKLGHYAINTIIIASSNYNFFKYRKMLIDFQVGFLYGMFNATRSAVKMLASNVTEQSASPEALTLLTLALEVFFKCLTFPFSLSYFDFKEEVNLEEVTILLFPDGFAAGLTDFELYDTLIRLLQLKLSREISLEITRILSRCAASRTSIMADDNLKQNFKQKMVECFIQMVYNSPLTDEAFVHEIIEAVLRIMFVSGVVGIVTQPFMRDNFREAANTLSDAIIILAYKLESKLAQQLIDFWKKLKTHRDSLNSLQLITRYLENFFKYNFVDRQQGCYFADSLKSFKRLKEHVDTSFENFRDLLNINLGQSCKMFCLVIDNFQNTLGDALGSQQALDMFVSKLGHFTLVFTHSFLKLEGYHSYTITRQDSTELEYLNTSARVSFGLFDLIGQLADKIGALDGPLYKGYVLSTLFFFETFAVIVVGSHSYNSEKDSLSMDDGLFKKMIEDYNFTPSFESFFETLTTTVTKNIGYKNFAITKASLYVIRVVVDKLKRVFNGKKNKAIFDPLCNRLIEQNNIHLTDPKSMKLRTYLYEVIGICYLDEKYYDYIENCHLVLNQILDNNKYPDGTIDLKRILYDLNGIYRAISYTKIISVYTKICYPRMQDLLTRFGGQNIGDSAFVVLLIDFYAHLFERTTQNTQVHQSQAVTFKIISDACRMISMLLAELNGAIEKLENFEAALQFVTSNIKIVKKFLVAFESLLKNSDISFSVFHYFGNEEFLHFSQSIFRFLFLITGCVITHFPDKQPLFFGVIKEGIRCLSDYILEYFQVEGITDVFKMLFMIFEKRMSIMVGETQTKTNAEDSVIEDIAIMIKSLLVTAYQESRIYVDDQAYQQKLNNAIASNAELAVEFCLKAFELAQLTNSSSRQLSNLSEIVFYFVIVFQGEDLLNVIIKKLVDREADQSTKDTICLCFETLSSRLRPAVDDPNKDEFLKHFNGLVKAMTQNQRNKSLSQQNMF